METKFDYEIDNRDISTTELHIIDGDGNRVDDITVEVNPWELLENVFENCDRVGANLVVERLEKMVRTFKSEIARSSIA